MSAYKIGEIAALAQVNVQTLRYYERQGILPPPRRRVSGYRLYDEDSLRRLLFIKRAQELGFTLEEIKELLDLRVRGAGSRAKVRRKAREKLDSVRAKIQALLALEATLDRLIRDCDRKRESGPCPILEKMEGKP
jgi:DNA-binding transcriptional MerR regulator